ncbi:MAG TPA: nuclear transport factor 2 family protein [Longimicrobiales bacterium]
MQTRYVLRTTALLMLASAFAGCAVAPYPSFTEKGALPAPPVPEVLMPADLVDDHGALLLAWHSGDPAALRSYYAENAVITTPTGYYRGWAEIESKWLTPTLKKISNLVVEPTRFTEEDGDIVERGWLRFTVMDNGKMRQERRAYAQRWQRCGGERWRVVSANITA